MQQTPRPAAVPARRFAPFVLATLLAATLALGLSLAPAARSAPSAVLLERCVGADGASVYTDRPCALTGARPAPLSPALLSRLASERHIAERQGDADASLPLPLAGAAAPSTPGRRSPADGCARSPRQLAEDLRGSLALGDVNRLAESYHWVGMSYRQGQRTLDRLARLLDARALDSRYYAAQVAALSDAGMAMDAVDARGGTTGILQLVLAGRGAPAVVEFDVHRYAGCYFVSFPQAGATAA